MEKKPCTVIRNSSDKYVKKQRNKKKVVNLVDQPKDDVPPLPPPPPPPPPPPNFSIPPGFSNEDISDIRRKKYMNLRPPPVTSDDYFQKLGFVDGYSTLMYVSNKKAKLPGKSVYALGRSWFKEGVTKKDKCVSKNMNKEKCHRSSDDKLKEFLTEFVEPVEAAKVLARMSRNKGMVQKNALSTSAPCSKMKSATKTLSLSDILAAIDQE